MNRRLIRGLLRLYPPAWRERYGEELEELLRAARGGLPAIWDILRSAFRERVCPSPVVGVTSHQPGSILALAKQPSAYLPVVMSAAALAVVLGVIVVCGVPHPAIAGGPRQDEGAAAHIWQLLMVSQIPVIACFLFKWLRKAPWLTLGVLGVQAGMVVAAMAPVFFLGL